MANIIITTNVPTTPNPAMMSCIISFCSVSRRVYMWCMSRSSFWSSFSVSSPSCFIRLLMSPLLMSLMPSIVRMSVRSRLMSFRSSWWRHGVCVLFLSANVTYNLWFRLLLLVVVVGCSSCRGL